jgi:hypothetical protein
MSGKRYLGSWGLPSGNSCDMYLIEGHSVLRLTCRPGPRPPEGQTGTTRQGAPRGPAPRAERRPRGRREPVKHRGGRSAIPTMIMTAITTRRRG